MLILIKFKYNDIDLCNNRILILQIHLLFRIR